MKVSRKVFLASKRRSNRCFVQAFVTVASTLLAVCSAQVFTPITDKNNFLRTPMCEAKPATELPPLARGNAGQFLPQAPAFGQDPRAFIGRGAGRKRRQLPENVQKFNASQHPFRWFTTLEADSGSDCERLSSQNVLNRGPVLVPLGTVSL